MRKRKLFWLSAITPLLSVIISTLLVFLTRADKHGVKIIQKVKEGLNPSSVKDIQLTGSHVAESAKIGLICAIIALTVCLLELDQYCYPTFFLHFKAEITSLSLFFFRRLLLLADHLLQ